MALINGNDYDHIDFTKNGVTTRHMLKDTLSRQMSGDLVKVQNEEPTSEGTKIWIKPSGDSEVQVPTYEEFEELSEKIDDADAAIESLAVGAQPTVSVTEVDGHKRFSFGIPASNGIASITKTATDGVIDTYTIAMTDGTSTSFSVNNSDITPESMAEAIATALQDYARIDGYYPDLTAGNADQLNSTKFVEDQEPYLYRPSGGTSDIGNRKYLDAIVGVSLPWNQMVRDEASENQTDFADILTVTDAVEDAASLKVKIEPQQDLHGYDHPWPAGGGVNKFNPSFDAFTVRDLYAGQLIGTGNGESVTLTVFDKDTSVDLSDVYFGLSKNGIDAQEGVIWISNGQSILGSRTVTRTDMPYVTIYPKTEETFNKILARFDVVAGISETAYTSFTPYSNVCPITGWDGVKVTRTGKNLYDISRQTVTNDNTFLGVSPKPNTDYVFSTDKAITGLYVAYSDDETMPRQSQNTGWTAFKTVYNNTFLSFNSGSHKWLRLMTYESGGRKERTLQLELGTTATAYEPYQGETYEVEFPTEAGTVYGGELTVDADGSGSLVVDKGYITKNTADMDNYEEYPGWKNSDIKAFVGADVQQAIQGAILNIGTGVAVNTKGINDVCYLPVSSYKKTQTEWIALALDVQIVVPLATPITYTLTASQIRTLLGTNNVWADTGDLALTYTGTDEHLTLESGKKYLARINGTDSMLLGSGQEITAAKGQDNVFDLTQMFGTAVADYVYGQGAAFFRKWFGKTRYPYNAGELLSVEGLQSHDVVGFNQWDEEWELGTYATSSGQKVIVSNQIRCKNPIPIIPGVQYCAKGMTWCGFYDNNLNIIEVPDVGFTPTARSNNAVLFDSRKQVFTAPADAMYMWFYNLSTYGTTYKHNISISFAHNGSRNGEYEPYEKHSHPLDNTVILRGVPKVDSNGVYWDGDRYLPDGAIERRYGVVDLGTLEWLKHSSLGYLYARIEDQAKPLTDISDVNVICKTYLTYSVRNIQYTSTIKGLSIGKTGFFDQYVIIKDPEVVDIAAFKAAMSGVMLVYELAEPTTEQALPYRNFQLVDDWGTEEFVTTGMIPVGHESRYPANLRDKLQHLPDAASSNGSYLITQTDGQMTLTPFPAPPTTAGKYALRATVTNGVATFTWEATT